MSGPASGVIAAAKTAMRAGFPNIVTYDMGGTSCDVALVQNGAPHVSTELELEYAMPIHVPMVDVHTIGAGGGSVARVDTAGILQVGPESAGARPGPVCYARGGVSPTITDANVALGRLAADRLLAVDRPVSIEQIYSAIMRDVGEPLGLSAHEGAAAIVRIANDRMAGAIRMVSLARGHDPRDFALFAFGGAGPLHAVALARELSIPKVVIPSRPGLTNAFGCVLADVRHDYARTVNKRLADIDDAMVRTVFEQQIADGRATIERERVPVIDVRSVHRADMQFEGQSHILTVDVPNVEVTNADLHDLFEAAYWQRFQVELKEIRSVLVNLHTSVIASRGAVALDDWNGASGRRALVDAAIERRPVWFDGGWLDTPVYRRDWLPSDAIFSGPAIVEQLDATTVVEPGNRVETDATGNLIVTV